MEADESGRIFQIVELLALLIRQTCGDVAVDEPPLRGLLFVPRLTSKRNFFTEVFVDVF